MKTLSVIVKPRAKKTEIVEERNDAVTIAVKAPPEDGRANLELLKFLAKHYRARPRIISGHTSKKKLIALDPVGKP